METVPTDHRSREASRTGLILVIRDLTVAYQRKVVLKRCAGAISGAAR